MTEERTVRIFLLRGLARESRHWGNFLQLLRKSGSKVKVFPLEIPGTGNFREENSPIRTSKYIPHLRSQFIPFRFPGDIHVILGLSFGGMLAAEWMRCHESDFQCAVLINSSGRPAPIFQRITIKGLLSLIKYSLTGDAFRREKIIASLICNTADAEKIAADWSAIAKSAPISAPNTLRQLYCAATFKFPSALDVPLLLLSSTRDRLVSPYCSDLIAQRHGAKKVTHPFAGHDLTTDDPEWCIAQLHLWLDSLYPPDRIP